jgi:predicted cupin superfamily sugar epimerase
MPDSEINLLVEKLQLIPHPEGGWYRETYRSPGTFSGTDEFPEGRAFCTAIYFLITHNNFSSLHRIKSDEIWHFYAGDPLEVVEINKNGQLIHSVLGNSISKGQNFQCTVPAGSWFGSRLIPGGKYALAGCTVSPGFDFRDFELASRMQLISEYPLHQKIITELTRV